LPFAQSRAAPERTRQHEAKPNNILGQTANTECQIAKKYSKTTARHEERVDATSEGRNEPISDLAEQLKATGQSKEGTKHYCTFVRASLEMDMMETLLDHGLAKVEAKVWARMLQ
jgi:hypothetical protein